MKELPLNALRAFAAIYAHGGVRAAARELEVAHSSVSRHLAELEAWLGVELVGTASGRQAARFTPQGDALGRAVVSGLSRIASATRSLRESKSVHAVTVSTTPSFAARWLLPRLPALERAHPRLEVSVLVNQKLEDLASGEVDLAIRMGRGPWPDLHCEPLMDDALFPVLSRAYFEGAGEPREAADLPGLRLLHDRDPQASWESWRKRYGPPTLNVQRGPRFASSDLVLRAAAQGQGVALGRQRLAADDLASGALLRPFGALAIELGVAYWLVRPDRPVKAATRSVIAWLHHAVEARNPGPSALIP